MVMCWCGHELGLHLSGQAMGWVRQGTALAMGWVEKGPSWQWPGLSMGFAKHALGQTWAVLAGFWAGHDLSLTRDGLNVSGAYGVLVWPLADPYFGKADNGLLFSVLVIDLSVHGLDWTLAGLVILCPSHGLSWRLVALAMGTSGRVQAWAYDGLAMTSAGLGLGWP
jgi:hypothetical protein